LKFGVAGLIAAAASTMVERWEGMDDNITVPIISLLILVIAKTFAPNLTIGLW
jgi:dolichol kinase